MTDKIQKFKELLDSYHRWPDFYLLKCVFPKGQLEQVQSILSEGEFLQSRESQNGNYLSVSVKIFCRSSDDVIIHYQKLATIEGVVCL